MSEINDEIKIAFLTSNLNCAREILNIIKKQESSPSKQDRFKLHPATDSVKLIELCTNHKFDIILIEEDFVDCLGSEWLARIDRAVALKGNGPRPPVILFSPAERSPGQLKTRLQEGFNDVMIKPLDMPILLQTIDRRIPDKNVLSEAPLFKLQTTDIVNVAVTMTFEAISESEITIVGDRQYGPGDIVGLYAGPFDEASSKEIVAVCSSSVLIAAGGNKYRSTFNLQGITHTLSRNIRKWIQSTCAKQRSA
jgi:CheY-like chemotaxis protein